MLVEDRQLPHIEQRSDVTASFAATFNSGLPSTARTWMPISHLPRDHLPTYNSQGQCISGHLQELAQQTYSGAQLAYIRGRQTQPVLINSIWTSTKQNMAIKRSTCSALTPARHSQGLVFAAPKSGSCSGNMIFQSSSHSSSHSFIRRQTFASAMPGALSDHP